MAIQSYETDVGKEYVILGNDAIMKCSIPSFVADFVSVTSWFDSRGNELTQAGGSTANAGNALRVARRLGFKAVKA